MDDSESATHVTVGRYELEVGALAGTVITAGTRDGHPPAELARALREKPQRDLLESADEATARIEDGVGVVKDVLEGTLLDPQRAVRDVDLLLELLQRQVKEGRLAEALRVARTVNGALALLMRWAELVRTLRVALSAAEKLGDKGAIAWAHHELGTLHLAAEVPAAAQEHLERARALRRELGDEAGLAATEHNLGYLCRQLRDLLRDGRFPLPRWPGRRAVLLAAALTLLFFLVGAVAAAIVKKPHDRPELIAWVQGQGRVISAPEGIVCDGGRCEHRFGSGQRITLVATPRHGSRFSRWTGDCHGHGACQLVLDHSKAVAAHFVPRPNTKTVHVHKEGNGRVTSAHRAIDCGTLCTTHTTPGEPAVLVAKPGPNATFLGWSGPCTGTGSCKFTVHDDVTVTARFAAISTPQSSTLTVRPAGTGSGAVSSSPRGIACGERCVKTFPKGTGVVLTQTADDGSRFAGWAGACTGTGRCTVRLDDAATVTARFDKVGPPANPTLTVQRTGEGTGTVMSRARGIFCGTSCSATFPKGTVVLVAIAGRGSEFRGWSGGGCGQERVCSVMLDQDTVVTARFEPTPPRLTSSSSGPGSISPSCPSGCARDPDEVVTLIATAEPNAYLVGWRGDCTPDPNDANRCVAEMSGDRAVSARFRENEG
jgi:Divergent InlB B-repeat domain